MKPENELPTPNDFLDARRATELIRVWAGDGKQHIVTRGPVWDDPAAWGLLLVDIARQVSRAYTDQGWGYQAALDRIVQGLQAELASNTNKP